MGGAEGFLQSDWVPFNKGRSLFKVRDPFCCDPLIQGGHTVSPDSRGLGRYVPFLMGGAASDCVIVSSVNTVNDTDTHLCSWLPGASSREQRPLTWRKSLTS